MKWGRHKFGLLAICLGVYALGLAAVPMALFDERPTWLGGRPRPAESASEPPTTRPGVTVSSKRFRFTFSRNKNAEAPPAVDAAPVASATPAPPAAARSRPFKTGSILVALFGLAAAALAGAREHGKALPAWAAAFCVTAIAFEYVLVGLVVGIAVVVVIVILGQ